MTFKVAAGNLLISVYKTVGDSQMTTTHIIPLTYLFTAIAVISFIIWAARRRRNSSE